MRRVTVATVLVVLGATAAGCGSSDVTDSEIAQFTKQVHAKVPYMQRYTNTDDMANLVKSVCDSFDSGQSYGNVSDTVGAYIDQPASSGEVDDVISIAIDTACPELNGKG